MRPKFCALRNKVVYAGKCLTCGKLKEGQAETESKQKVWDCQYLFLKVTFNGFTHGKPTEDSPVGSMERYRYTEMDMFHYS